MNKDVKLLLSRQENQRTTLPRLDALSLKGCRKISEIMSATKTVN